MVLAAAPDAPTPRGVGAFRRRGARRGSAERVQPRTRPAGRRDRCGPGGPPSAGVPTGAEATAVVCALLVVTVQVVAVAMSWSIRRPFSVDLRSARATPAPPVVMVGYSARLATSTTMTAMVFSALSWTAPGWVSVAVAAPLLVWSGLRWRRAAARWADAPTRALVVTTVAA